MYSPPSQEKCWIRSRSACVQFESLWLCYFGWDSVSMFDYVIWKAASSPAESVPPNEAEWKNELLSMQCSAHYNSRVENASNLLVGGVITNETTSIRISLNFMFYSTPIQTNRVSLSLRRKFHMPRERIPVSALLSQFWRIFRFHT